MHPRPEPAFGVRERASDTARSSRLEVPFEGKLDLSRAVRSARAQQPTLSRRSEAKEHTSRARSRAQESRRSGDDIPRHRADW